jgi:protein O-mannosyl-transferase
MATRRAPAAATAPPRATPAARQRSLVIAIAAALAATVLGLYAQTARFEFLTLDDQTFIVENPPVLAGLTWDSVRWAFTEAYYPNWHPLTWLSHMLDVSLFGLRAGPPHLVSAGLHALNAVLVFLTLLYLTGALWPSALAAALFAVHPMRAESVAWLSERKDVTSGLFWILTTLAYAWYARRPALLRYLLVAGLLVLGLMSKTMLVSLPLLLLLLDVWPLQRWAPLRVSRAAPRPGEPTPASLPWLVVEKLPLVALAAIASWITVYTQQTVRAVQTTADISLAWRLANALLAYASYLRKTVWPSDLAGFYPHPALNGTPLADVVWPAVAAALVLALITASCVAAVRRRPYLLVGWLWFVVALVPVIGLMQVGMQSMADRYIYLAGLGLYVMLAWGGRDLMERWPQSRVPLVAAAGVALGAYTAVSWVQIGTWRNSQALYERAIAVTHDNYLAQASLGAWLRTQGRTDEAAPHFREALRIRPQEPYALMQYGALLADQGQLDEAARNETEALRLSPGYAQAYANLGLVRMKQDRLEEAAANFEAALRLKPLYAMAEGNLGAARLKQGRYDEAAAHLQRAIALEPGSAEAHNNLGVALVQQGDLHAAAAQFETALRLKPGHANATRNLQWVRQQLGSS